MYKQVIIIRKDLKMSKGKTAVQVAHASISAAKKVDKKISESWEKAGQKKAVLRVDSREALLELKSEAEKKGLKTFLVKDAGMTELEPGTITTLAIGPDNEKNIDQVTGELKLLD